MVLEMQFRCTEILYHREREIAIQGRGFFAAFGGGGGILPGGSRGIAASRRRGRDAAGRQPGTRPSRGEGQKGVQDTRTCVPVSYTPSCDSP